MGSLSKSISLFCIIVSIVLVYGTETPNVAEYIKLRSGKENYRIIGGHPAIRKNWPFMAAITIGKMFVCGGSLIRKNWVLTAAHCVTGKSPEYLIKRGHKVGAALGLDEIKFDFKIKVLRGLAIDIQDLMPMINNSIPCEFFKVHPKYTVSQDKKLTVSTKDAALLKLPKALILSELIDIVPLPTKHIYNGMKCTSAGWGLSELTTASNQKVYHNKNVLYEVDLEIIPKESCNSVFCTAFSENGLFEKLLPGLIHRKITKLLSDKLCTLSEVKNEGVNKGDSGGPLICDGELQGVTNIMVALKSKGEMKLTLYGLFLEINKITSWMNETLISNGGDPLPRSVPTAKGTKLVFLNYYCIPLFFVVHLICLRI